MQYQNVKPKDVRSENERYCIYCGSKLMKNNDYCSECGTKLDI
ncbi:MAG: hypothetical protein ACW99L_19045 [Promethearchaeota archaeon]